MYLGQTSTVAAYENAADRFVTGDMAGASAALSSVALPEMGQAGLLPMSIAGGPIGAAIGGALALGVSLLHLIGRGRREADLIVPVQNQIGQRLKEINDAIPTAVSPAQLQGYIVELQAIGKAFKDFVSRPEFTDGRASQQALDTIMPLIDGTSGYRWPPPMQSDRQHAGPSGGGEDGTIGTLQRRLMQLGTPLSPPLVTQGPNGGFLPSLQYQQESIFPWLPQGGTLPATYAPQEQYPVNPEGATLGGLGGVSSLLTNPLVLLAGGYFVFRRLWR